MQIFILGYAFVNYYHILPLKLQTIRTVTRILSGSRGGRSGTVGGRFLGCFFWVLPKTNTEARPTQKRYYTTRV